MFYRIITICIIFVSACSHAKSEYVRVMFNHNAATNATIGWSQVSGENGVVLLSKSEFTDASDLKDFSTHAAVNINTYKGIDNRYVRLTDLSPNTAYYFLIKDSEGHSERYWFKTAPGTSDERISLICGGDSRSRRVTRVQGFKMAAKLKPHAIVFGGDYTDIDNEDKWRGWFEDWTQTYVDFDNQCIPIIAARGNHEHSDDNLVNFFDCPSEENYFSVSIGGDLINLITLNTEHQLYGGKQKKWLEETLMKHNKYFWQIPQYHRACRPHVKWKLKMRGPKQIYRKWIALLEKYGVQLVIECDTHITKVTWPIVKGKGKEADEGFIRDDENGIVYVGEGCWGAPLRTADVNRTWTRNAGSVNSFKWVFVDREGIELRTIDYTNVAEVKTLTEETRFEIPEKLRVWDMDGEGVVSIKNKRKI